MNNSNTEHQYIAKTFKGLEDVLASELVALGANNVQIERRAVSFTGDKRLLYKANLWLRTASRVLMPICSFKAKDADEVYERVKKIEWEKYITLNMSFSIDSTVYSDTFRHSKYVTYRTKDAIADRFMELEGKRPSVQVSSPDIFINVHIANESVTISLDSSGESLHKRGWRKNQTAAPLNEALAAGMLLLAGWNGETDFCDPMCGSGTLLIEAAMIALNIPPGIYRAGFAFENWLDFDKELFEELYNDDADEKEFIHHIYGSDTSFYAVKTAEENIKAAGLQKYISVKQIRMQELDEHQPCLVVMNPPYGERLRPKDKAQEDRENTDSAVCKLYDEIGTILKHKFAGSTAWIISSNEAAMQNIGLHASRRIKLLNGELDCSYNKYELFKGERKKWKDMDSSNSEGVEAVKITCNKQERNNMRYKPANPQYPQRSREKNKNRKFKQ